METAVVALSIVCAVQAVVLAVAAGVIPLLWWRLDKQEHRLDSVSQLCVKVGEKQEALEQVVDGIIKAAGIQVEGKL